MTLQTGRKSICIHTLGCKVNSYESEAIWQLFEQAGYQRVQNDVAADVFVVNTCTVTNTGDKKSRQVIRRAVRNNPDAVICVTGCYAQIASDQVLEIPGVDIVIGTQERDRLVGLVQAFERSRQPINAVSNIMKTKVFEELSALHFTERTRASLKIQEGCNNFCTFCIIPWARGLIRSRKPESVVEQMQKLVQSGYQEIVLTGIHTGGYGHDLEDCSLAQLLTKIDREVDSVFRVRIASVEASQITDELINVLAKSDKFVPHLHVPLQSGSDTVLTRMNRKYSVRAFAERLARLREVHPRIAITTDVIVGFPGETEEEFQETYDFTREMKFSELHVFPYSKRTGTPAATYPNQVAEDVKEARVEKLIALSNMLALEYARGFCGEMVNVIPEDTKVDGQLVGYAENYLRIVFDGQDDLIGQVVKVKVLEAGYPFSKGEIVV